MDERARSTGSSSATATAAAAVASQEHAAPAAAACAAESSSSSPAAWAYRKRARRAAIHRASAAEICLEEQQHAAQQEDSEATEEDTELGLGLQIKDSWFQPKWVPGPLFAVRDVLGAFPASQPATAEENPALVRAEADPRYNLEDLRALSYDEYVEEVIEAALVCSCTSTHAHRGRE